MNLSDCTVHVSAVLHRLRQRITDAARSIGSNVAQRVGDALRPKSALLGLVGDLTRTHGDLVAENAALRQQLILLKRTVKKPQLRPIDRVLLVVTAAFSSTWRETILIAKPETVLRWHRQGFRLFWRRKSRRKKQASRVPADVVLLIQRMSKENATWGAERIRGELLKLDVRVSKRTIQRYLKTPCPRRGTGGQRWSTFLENHTVWACDFVQTHDCWFRPIFAFFIVDVNKKTVLHVGVTRSPSEAWTAQQLREATPFGQGSDVIIRDRDGKFGAAFDRIAEGAGMRVVQTPVRTPNMNAVCERFIGSARRECLAHVLILGERHMLRILKEYAFAYFNRSRPHQGLQQRPPTKCEREPYRAGVDVMGFPFLRGLHHDYRVAA